MTSQNLESVLGGRRSGGGALETVNPDWSAAAASQNGAQFA